MIAPWRTSEKTGWFLMRKFRPGSIPGRIGTARRRPRIGSSIWTQGALEELDAIHAYIDQFNPLAAELMSIRLKQLAASLRTAPDRGRPISLGQRQLAVVKPYLMRYQRNGDTIYILEVRHSSREPNI